MYDWLNHTCGSTQIECCPEAWNLTQCCFICLHNTDASMLCRLFDDRKYMDIYLRELKKIEKGMGVFKKKKKKMFFYKKTEKNVTRSCIQMNGLKLYKNTAEIS